MIADDITDWVERRVCGDAKPYLHVSIDTVGGQSFAWAYGYHGVEHLLQPTGEVLADGITGCHCASAFRHILVTPSKDRPAPARCPAQPLHDLGGFHELETIEEAVRNARTAAKPSNKIGVADPALWRNRFGPVFQNMVSAYAMRRRQIGTAEDSTTGGTTRHQHPAMPRATRYFREIPPRPTPRPTGDRSVTLLDISAQAIRADAGKVTGHSHVAAAAHQFAGENAPIVGMGDRVPNQCFQRESSQPRDIRLISPTLQVANEVATISKRNLSCKFRAAFTAVAQSKTIEQCPRGFERRRPHA